MIWEMSWNVAVCSGSQQIDRLANAYAYDDGLRSDNRSENCNDHAGNQHVRRTRVENRISVRLRVNRDIGSLSSVGEKEAWQAPAQPTDLYSSLAERSQIGE